MKLSQQYHVLLQVSEQVETTGTLLWGWMGIIIVGIYVYYVGLMPDSCNYNIVLNDGESSFAVLVFYAQHIICMCVICINH